MRMAMPDETWDEIESGAFVGADGLRYSRRSTRLKRAVVNATVSAGAALVVHMWSEHQLDWHDGAEAAAAWDERRAHLTVGRDRPATKRSDPVWTAGLWESDDGSRAVLLTGDC